MLNKSNIPEEESNNLPSEVSLEKSDDAENFDFKIFLSKSMDLGVNAKRWVNSDPVVSKNDLLTI